MKNEVGTLPVTQNNKTKHDDITTQQSNISCSQGHLQRQTIPHGYTGDLPTKIKAKLNGYF